MTIVKPNIKGLKGSTGRTFTWDGNVIFHKTSGQITVQQVKVLTERITLGAKICRTYSLACPASFVLHKRLNESENHLQLPSWGFLWYKRVPGVDHPMGRHTPLQSEQREGRAQWGKACLGFAAPAACSWSMSPWEMSPSGTIWCQGSYLSSQRVKGLHSSSPSFWCTEKRPTARGHVG